MNAKKRKKNEREFEHWEELSDGGRNYWFEVKGKSRWTAKYVKVVDAEETTVSFKQEIYDTSGKLVEIHEKYPEDKGHKKVAP